MTATDWLVPGAKVAVITPYRAIPTRVITTSVRKIIGHTVHLENGGAFSTTRLFSRSSGGWHQEKLVTPDDPEVALASRTIIAHKCYAAIKSAISSENDFSEVATKIRGILDETERKLEEL